MQHLLLIQTLGLRAETFFRGEIHTVAGAAATAPGKTCIEVACRLCSADETPREERGRPAQGTVARCPSCGIRWICKAPHNIILTLSDRWIDEICGLASTPGVSLAEASAALGVRDSALRTAVHQLGIDRPDWQHDPDGEATLQRHREVFLELRAAHPADGTKALRQRAYATYSYLWNHDRSCLKAHTPAHRAARPSRVDWNARDQRLFGEVKRVIAEMRAEEGRPQRMARTTIMKCAGFTSGEGQQVARLPATAELLKHAEESIAAFAERRVRWAADEIRRNGPGLYVPVPTCRLTQSRLVNEANLSRTQQVELENVIHEILRGEYEPNIGGESAGVG